MNRILAAAAVLGFLTAGVAAAAISPSTLYHRLLTRQFPDSALPRGFSGAQISPYVPTADARKLQLIDGVLVVVSGKDPADAIAYSIWKTSKAAAFALVHPEQHPGTQRLKVVGTVTVHGSRGVVVEGAGSTYAAVRVGQVIVNGEGLTDRKSGPGNRASAVALLGAGLLHLRLVERG